jgi:hypothetical protein
MLVLAQSAAVVAQDAARRLEEVRRFSAREATQAVAVDDRYVYAITTRAIGKYDKRSGNVIKAVRY